MDTIYIGQLRSAAQDLVQDVDGLDDSDMAGATLLPDWDRAMLVTHVAARSEGVLRAVQAAERGEVGQVYPGGRPARDAGIEAGRGRPADELKDRLRRGTSQLQAALERAPESVWRAKALHGQEVDIANLVTSQVREVLVHHVDLQVGYGPRQWPTPWVVEEMDLCMLDLPARLPAGVATVLEATDIGQRWVAGSGDELDISGDLVDLFTWLIGRASTVPGQEVPALRPWR